MDTATLIILIAESAVILAFIILMAFQKFGKYKGKQSLDVNEILKLGEELLDYAKEASDRLSSITDLTVDNFNNEADYREYLTKKLVEDLDSLLDSEPNAISNSALYQKLTTEDKVKLINLGLDKIPSKATCSNEEVIQDADEMQISMNDDQNKVDIGDYLNS